MPLHSTFVYEGFQDLAAKICIPLEIIFALSHFPDYITCMHDISFQKSYVFRSLGMLIKVLVLGCGSRQWTS